MQHPIEIPFTFNWKMVVEKVQSIRERKFELNSSSLKSGWLIFSVWFDHWKTFVVTFTYNNSHKMLTWWLHSTTSVVAIFFSFSPIKRKFNSIKKKPQRATFHAHIRFASTFVQWVYSINQTCVFFSLSIDT